MCKAPAAAQGQLARCLQGQASTAQAWQTGAKGGGVHTGEAAVAHSALREQQLIAAERGQVMARTAIKGLG